MGAVSFSNDGGVEGSPLAKKWWGELVPACRKETPEPQMESADTAGELAKAKRQYECLSKAGLDSLHSPTGGELSLFSPEGTAKYFGENVDPHSKSVLTTCGIGN